MKRIILTLLLFGILYGCKKETAQPVRKLSATAQLKVASDIPTSDMEFDLIGMVRYGDIITLKVAHWSGCDPDASFKLYLVENSTENCSSETIYLVYKTKNQCKSLVNSEINFDLKSYKFCSKTIIIKGATKDMEITI